MSQGMIKRDEGHSFLAKLPAEEDVALRDLLEQTRRMTIPSPSLSQPSIDYPPSSGSPLPGSPIHANVPSAKPNVQHVKVLWSFNENGLQPNDLSFREGDVIEIVDQTGADWWTGKLNGKQGHFPSSYVERIPSSPPSYTPPRDTQTASSSPKPYQSGATSVYDGSPQDGYQSQPQRPYSPYPPPQSQSVLPQQVFVQQARPPVNFNRYGGRGSSASNGALYGQSLINASVAAGSETIASAIW